MLKEAVANLLARPDLDAVIIPKTDEFLGEYVPKAFERLADISGFTGSNGIALIFKEKKLLFTDGRYLLQAKTEAPEFIVIDQAEQNVIDFIDGKRIAIDPWLHNVGDVNSWQARAQEIIFTDLPSATELSTTKVHEHKVLYAGESSADKILRVAKLLRENDEEAFVITSPVSLCYLFNIRASDVPYTPLCLARGIVYANGTADLFIARDRIDFSMHKSINIRSIDDFIKVIVKLEKARINPSTTPFAVYKELRNPVLGTDPIAEIKSIKNPTELGGAINAWVRESAVFIKCWRWLSAGHGLTEMDVGKKLVDLRSKDPLYRGDSFAPIAAAGPNGAVVHYHTSESSNRAVQGMFLLDTGGQYLDATTDMTRTIFIGNDEPTADQIEHYTLVLKGHIALANAIFPKGTTGEQLDALARQFLWGKGLDYGHGTGHGVGSFLSVHETPPNISKRGKYPLAPGMITSIEPGFYLEGRYGIRLENLYYVGVFGIQGFYRFFYLTLVPFDRRLINVQMLTTSEINWLNLYHDTINKKLQFELSDAADLDFLAYTCQPLGSE